MSHPFLDPFARLAVWCALSSYSSHKGQASSRQKKRHREDIEVGGPLLRPPALCSPLTEPLLVRGPFRHRQPGPVPAPGPLCQG